MENLEKYILLSYPHIIQEYNRKTTSNYYEAGVLYHPITSGFGCTSEGSNEPFEIENGVYLKSGDIQLTLVSKINKYHRCGVLLSEAHKKIKRIDESVLPIGNPIPNSKKVLYIKDFRIHQHYFTNHNKLGGRIIIHKDGFKGYWELYSYIGNSSFSLKHVHSYDSVNREQYTIKHNVSVREFKQTVFGDSNIKFKCDLFSHL